MTFMIWDSGITLAVKKSKGAVQLTLTIAMVHPSSIEYAGHGSTDD